MAPTHPSHGRGWEWLTERPAAPQPLARDRRSMGPTTTIYHAYMQMCLSAGKILTLLRKC